MPARPLNLPRDATFIAVDHGEALEGDLLQATQSGPFLDTVPSQGAKPAPGKRARPDSRDQSGARDHRAYFLRSCSQ